MVERIRSERKARGRRAVVASLALSTTVCLGLWKGGAPRSALDIPPPQRALNTSVPRDLTSLELAGFDTTPVFPWLATRSEKTPFPPLRITGGGALVDWSAGPSFDDSSLGRATSLVAPLFSIDGSRNSSGLSSGILTGLPNSSGEIVGPVGSWDKLGLGASPSLSTAIDTPLVICVDHNCPPLPMGDEVARVSHRVGRWLVGDFSSPGAEPFTAAAGWASRASLLTSPQLATGGDRLAFASSPVAPKVKANAPVAQGKLDWLEPELAEQIEAEATETWLPQPTSLVEQIAALSSEPLADLWANEALAVLATLERQPLAPKAVEGQVVEQQVVEHLARLSQSAWQLAEQAPDERLAVRLRQASLAIWRRVECWNAAAKILQPRLEHIALASNYTSVLKAHPVSLRTASRPKFGRAEIVELLAAVERYESTHDIYEARVIARAIDELERTGDKGQQRLATALDDTYRNANVRMSLTKDFLELWLPQQSSRTEPVVDRIVGTPVRGQAHVTTTPGLEFIPNSDAWQIVLGAEGSVESSTTARRGSVSVTSRGNTHFSASQQLLFDGYGIHRGEVLTEATSSSHFLRARSSYDLFPIVRGIVRNQARDRFAATRHKARREIEMKTEERVRTQFEAKMAEALREAESRWRSQVGSRLMTGGIELEGVEFQTTESRLISRARLLEVDQLTSHTPRPRAPYDSVASLQVHESALRGLASTLQLDGARFTSEELTAWLSQHLGQSLVVNPDEREESATIRFAPERAIDVALRDGQLELTLSIYELTVRDILVRDFKVHTYYTPRVDGLSLAFERTEGPYFEGALRNRERMQLNTIFNKNQQRGERLEIGRTLLGDPRIAGLAITQLVIDDGWLGIALGQAEPHRLTQRDRYQSIR